jgi:hypothetical protein
MAVAKLSLKASKYYYFLNFEFEIEAFKNYQLLETRKGNYLEHYLKEFMVVVVAIELVHFLLFHTRSFQLEEIYLSN